MPVGSGVGAVDGFGEEVEFIVAFGDVVAVPVGYIAVGIGEYCVIRGELALHGFEIVPVTPGLGAEIALLQGGDGNIHQFHGDPLTIFFVSYRAVGSVVRGESAIGGAGGCFVADGDRLGGERFRFSTVFVLEWRGTDHGFEELIDSVDAA